MKRNILVILMVIIALMACKTDSDSDPECNCPVKDHLGIGENCYCGKNSCTCTVQEYGKVNGIPVYRTSAISNAQMAGVVAKVQAGYDGMSGSNKPNFIPSKVSAIYFTDGIEDIDTINKIIKLDVNNCESLYLSGAFDYIITGPLALLKLNDGIKLALGQKVNTTKDNYNLKDFRFS